MHATAIRPLSLRSEVDPSARAFLRALGAAVALVSALSLVMGLTTLPHSGPMCTSDCVGYPYTDVARFVPRDYLWMYPQSLLLLLVLVLMVALHETAGPRVRVSTGTAAILTSGAVVALLVDYGIQLAVLQPSLLRGETSGLALFSQYNPHGVFIAVENVGYLLMGLAFLAAALGFPASRRLGRAIRWVLAAGGGLIVVLLVVLALAYGADLEYRFEVWAIATWLLVLLATGVLMTISFGTAPVQAAPDAEERSRRPDRYRPR